MKPYKSRGVVLHTLKYGDSGMIVYMLTDTLGRCSYMVQGVGSKRGRGSKLALFQPLFALEFEGLSSPKMELHRFGEVRNALTLKSTPFDVRKSTIALFMAETIYRLVREQEPSHHLFEFIWGSIEALDTIEDGVANFHLWFLSHLSHFLGFRPDNGYFEGAWFDIRSGQYIAAPDPRRSDYINPDNAKLLNTIMECDIRNIDKIQLNRTQRNEYLGALLNYYAFHLDAIHSIRSLEILREVF